MPSAALLRPYVIVDVFTDVPLLGNPLAVFTDASGLGDELMQRTARELNLSETVFVLPGDGEADARIRIFTPGSELPFAGHPVLGTAFVLSGQLESSRIRLRTGAGVVPVTFTREHGESVFGEMEQPIPRPEPFPAEAELLAALGVEKSELPVEAYRNGPLHVYVSLPDEDSVAALMPDLKAVSALGPLGVNCTAPDAVRARFRTRSFAPALGVPEDPATGSAAGPLALHLARHGRIAFGEQIEIRQGTEIGRPSLLYARAEGSPERVERVLVGGSAVVVARGEYRLA